MVLLVAMECGGSGCCEVTWVDCLGRQCLQRVKDSVEKGILIDVWPLFDADSLVEDGPMPTAFKSTPFFENL